MILQSVNETKNNLTLLLRTKGLISEKTFQRRLSKLRDDLYTDLIRCRRNANLKESVHKKNTAN